MGSRAGQWWGSDGGMSVFEEMRGQDSARYGPPNLRTYLDVSRAMGRQAMWSESLKLLDEAMERHLAQLPDAGKRVWLLRCTVHRLHALAALEQVRHHTTGWPSC
jgi:hypothetical protein